MHNFCTQLLSLMSYLRGILAKLHPFLNEVVLRCCCFLVSSSNIFKVPFLEHLCTMATVSSLEKDFIATIRDYYKNCIFARKIIHQLHTQTSRTEELRKKSVLILLKNGCSVRHMFFSVFAPLSVTKNVCKNV